MCENEKKKKKERRKEEKEEKEEKEASAVNGKQVQDDRRTVHSGQKWGCKKVFSRVDTAEDNIHKQMRACVRGVIEPGRGGGCC